MLVGRDDDRLPHRAEAYPGSCPLKNCTCALLGLALTSLTTVCPNTWHRGAAAECSGRRDPDDHVSSASQSTCCVTR